MKFYIVDAFANQLFQGNTAGVVLLEDDFPTEEIMLKLAAELRYSETAFVKRINESEFNIRYFTPAAEVDLCGHATIAAFYCLVSDNYIKAGHYINHTLAGDISIDIDNNIVYMAMPKPEILSTISDDKPLQELYNVMGIKYTKTPLFPKIVKAGLADIMLPVADKSTLNSITPDFEKLALLSQHYDVVGVHAFSVGKTIDTRNFAPLYDIDEEAATGTSNAGLTYYLYKEGLLSVGELNSIIQGEKMGRKSIIKTIMTGENSIQVGGSAKIVAKGEIFFSITIDNDIKKA